MDAAVTRLEAAPLLHVAAGVEAKAFGVTLEPAEGSATPTMPLVMAGAGE